MKEIETLVAVVPEQTPADETKLTREVTDVEFRAEAMLITTEDDYKQAAEFGKLIKQKAAEVTSFFKPMKDAAYQSHKAVCDREKDMLTPLKNAEAVIKKTMRAYLEEQEKIRREREEALRRAAEAERERKLKEAAELEKAGDMGKADEAIEEAIVMDEASRYTEQQSVKPKVSGVSTSKDWEIVDIDNINVPLSFAGVEIRPVDRAALMRLIRASKGQITIPGVTYKEVAKMSFSRR